jgi:hypothetical protein
MVFPNKCVTLLVLFSLWGCSGGNAPTDSPSSSGGTGDMGVSRDPVRGVELLGA